MLESVQVKKNCLEEFKLPFNIVYGKIGKLSASLPWRNLSSEPVEILLESLHLIITPKPREEWGFIDLSSYDRKIAALEDFVEKFLEQLKINQESKSDEEMGYLDRLNSKIIDNIQIDIKNIHIRLEDHTTSSEPLSLGHTHKELKLHTCNKDWN